MLCLTVVIGIFEMDFHVMPDRKISQENVYQFGCFIDGTWIPYATPGNNQIASHYSSSPSMTPPLKLTLSFSVKFNTKYTIDFQRMVQVNNDTSVVRPICIMPASYHNIIQNFRPKILRSTNSVVLQLVYGCHTSKKTTMP
jgi:hypothetical protein